ncbi:hypothetical protein X474_15845 [Dethiosulfatarculus sandiegensis]|uniref:Uncharacterized protein n=1 Tax=Dethiosulfatarculus sandiegensis TaxID=1429043 RepID=A0A0D2JBE4_9BACT|nr:hypothetical protein X474_15845 [Dethiosulfatarculus sandiegensis]
MIKIRKRLKVAFNLFFLKQRSGFTNPVFLAQNAT